MKVAISRKCLQFAIGTLLFCAICFHVTCAIRGFSSFHDDESLALRSAFTNRYEESSTRKKGRPIKNLPEKNVSRSVSNPLDRDFSRIPGYIEGSNNSSLFGYVMRDLSNRFLLPASDQQKRKQRDRNRNRNANANRWQWQSSSSSTVNVLVVSPGANKCLSDIATTMMTTMTTMKKEDVAELPSKQDLIKRFGYRIGPSFLVESIYNGHNVIGVDSGTGMMNEYGSDKKETTPTTSRPRTNATDIFLAIFDPEQGQEDNAVPVALQNHIRSGSIEFATFRISNSFGNSNSNGGMQGIDTSKIFLDAGYKLQVLSSSHAPTDTLNPYGPNTLLKNAKDIEAFLMFGMALATKTNSDSRELFLPKTNTIRNGPSTAMPTTTTTTTTSSGTDHHRTVVFHSILFATRGLDLAIPSRKAFLDKDKGNDELLDVKSNGVPYLHCPINGPSTETAIKFLQHIATKNDGKYHIDDYIYITCFGRNISISMENTDNTMLLEDEQETTLVELWHSHPNITLSEAACAKCTKSTRGDEKAVITVAGNCTTHLLSDRFISKKLPTHAKSPKQRRSKRKVTKQPPGPKRAPNLLAIELRGVNQNMLDLSLPGFKKSLLDFGLEHVPNYIAALKPNNFSNKTWWAAGAENNDAMGGHQRYRGFNRCSRPILNSDDEPVTYHGSQLGGIFCFDYDRPNCLYGKHAATYLFHHVNKFIRRKRRNLQRWAAYITLIEGEEETESLVGTLELPLSDFLFHLKSHLPFEEWSNTIIAIFSDEDQEPVLFLKADSDNETMQLKERKVLSTLDLNYIMQSIISTEDVEEIRKALQTYNHLETDDSVGIVDSPVPGDLDEYKFGKENPIAPPSILSFYADIPKENKFRLLRPSAKIPRKRAKVVKGCKCATNTKPWFSCNYHPWSTSTFHDKDTFILVDCPNRRIHLEINVVRNEVLLRRSTQKRNDGGSAHLDKINIIFLELDSVSLEYANRHFPKTRELLKKYRIKQVDENDFECLSGMCSAEFPYTSLVGANSIPNQVAALSGCISTTTQELCGIVDPLPGDICNDVDMPHYGLRLERIRLFAKMAYWCPIRDTNTTRTPWLFGVSDSKGYLNFFGEEFCYDESPYVTQGNVFPKFYLDIQSHHVFCSLVERKILKGNPNSIDQNRLHRWAIELKDPCIEGFSCSKNFETSAISLEYIEQMWNEYADCPKLAFLNVMAAHDYSPDWEMMIPKAESYDEHLLEFLETMISRVDWESTAIIIRSDHGLQKGPMAVDYALQVEHRHPWTEVLIPESLVLSKSALFHNQARMLNGFDLYHTMRLLMSDRSKSKSLEGGIPDWSFDIIAEEIPESRTCEQSKVDPYLCRKVKQTRNFGVCNNLDPSQVQFCSTKRANKSTEKAAN